MSAIVSHENEQATIKKWFENTYKVQGYLYLRPKVAYYLFISLLKVQKGSKLLDVACGPGLMMKVAEENGLHPSGIDLSETAVTMCKKLVKTGDVRVGNAAFLPYESNTFDYITCIGALERMLDLEKVLKEQIRVAKEDAVFCYMVRNSENIFWTLKTTLGLRNIKGHQGAKSLEEWKKIFTGIGFEIQSIKKDSWRWIRWLRWLTLGSNLVNYYKERSIPVKLEKAYEFIFILKKK
jgi:ubiquinone/menaquinone biosynthesis C-methylase UbiE